MSVLCLGEVWLELNAATAPELTETFQAQTGGWGAGFCRQYAALGGQAALLAQLGADPFGRKLAARLARDGVDCSLLCFTDAFPTPVVFTGADTALPYRAHTAGLALGPEQLEAAPFRGASAFCFSSAGLVDSPLRLAHLKALAAARDAGALCCYLPRLAQAAPYWPQREALCQTALQFLDRADVLFFRGERPAPPLRLPGAAHSPVCSVLRPCAADLFLQKGQDLRLYTQCYGFCRKKRPEPRSGLVSDGTNGDPCNRSATVKGACTRTVTE